MDDSNLPPGWVDTRLESFVTDARTGLVRSSELQSIGRTFPYIKMQNFDLNGKWHLSNLAYVDATEVEAEQSCLRPGDLLFNTRNSVELVGKTALWDGQVKAALYNNNLLRVRFCPAVEPAWVSYQFKCPQFRLGLEAIKSATTSVAAIYQKALMQQTLKVAPLNEQRRIVRRVDHLCARSNAAKEALDAIPPLLERFRQSVLAAAFRGDLTKDWRVQNPNVEPASVLLDRIRAERRQRWEEAELAKVRAKGKEPKDDKWQSKYTEPEQIDSFDLPELPDGWNWTSVNTIAAVESHALSSGPFGSALGAKDYVQSGTPVIRGQNIKEGTVDLTSNFVFVTTEKAKELRRSSAKPGDVVVIAVGSSGRAAVVPASLRNAILSQNCNKVSCDRALISPSYLNYFLVSDFAQKRIAGKTTDTVRKFFSLTNFKLIPVPLPSLQEQEELVRLLTQAFVMTARIVNAHVRAFSDLTALSQSILAKAFRGELVPQDPNDEHASVLLERIRAEREAKSPGGNGKKPKAK